MAEKTHILSGNERRRGPSPDEAAASTGIWERCIFTGRNVVDEARFRIRTLLMEFDTVVVSFSGGKDSLACLDLVRQEMDALGMEDVPVPCIFRDEELIPSSVISVCERYHDDPRYDMVWAAAPMLCQMSVMGDMQIYTQWDPDREWVRQPPPYAVRDIGNGGRALKQHHFENWTASLYTGKIAMILGIRTFESMIRQRAVFQSHGPRSFIKGSKEPRITNCWPIYDWTATDIFKYFQDNDIAYSEMYELEMWTGAPLRVATPLHDSAHDGLKRLARMDPVFFEALLKAFPHVGPQCRYFHEISRQGTLEIYDASFAGIKKYMDDHMEDNGMKQQAMKALRDVMQRKEHNIREGRMQEICGNGYPLRYIFFMFMNGGYLRGILPQLTPNEFDEEYEARAVNGGFG